MDLDARADHARLGELQELIDGWIARHGGELGAQAAAVSGWSAEQHLAHVALANELVLRNLHNLARGSGLLVSRGGEPIEGARELLAAGVIPRGRAQSPRMVRPPAAVERELLLVWLADGRRELARLDPATVVSNGLTVPHQMLGPLDAPQWLRFAVVHTQHHLTIAREVLQAAGVECSSP